jgi:hypothetical protein
MDLNTDAGRLVDVFDVGATNLFLMSHLLEHLRDPRALMRELQNFQNSYVFIEVPDFGSRHTPATLHWQMNGLEHEQYFNDASLIQMLHGSGFRVLAFETQTAPDMTVIRAICSPRRAGAAGIAQHNRLLDLIAERLRDQILSQPADRGVWVWGLSPYMAKALTESEDARSRVRSIVDNRYPDTRFAGLEVLKEPGPPPEGRPLILCGSTYSVVQTALRDKARKLWPEAEFVTPPLND